MNFRPWWSGLALLLVLSCEMHAQMVEVRVEPVAKIQDFIFQSQADETVITTADSFPIVIAKINTLDKVSIKMRDQRLVLMWEDRILGEYPEVLLWSNDKNPRFKLLFKDAAATSKTYSGHLRVEPTPSGIALINVVHLEEYIRGVISAEAGIHKNLDFFKVQALSARTYALNNLGRHKAHGYDLCDNTHCQAYKGEYQNNPLIDQAVAETKGEVIVFNGNQLIDAVFSANCGGYTANSEDVWIANVNYLRSMPDYDFCEGFNNHSWHVTIPKLEFLAKLGRYLNAEATRFEIVPDVSGRVRRVFINGNPGLTISGEELRRLFKFRSSRFHVYDAQSLLFVEGSGFGHGVGMCQDGAYYLSQTGLDYTRIIQHYYKDTEILLIDEVKGIWE
jgi:stage II sporulation protein D